MRGGDAMLRWIVEKFVVDTQFRQQLPADPKIAIGREPGIAIPESMTVEVHESDMRTVPPARPPAPNITGEQLGAVSAGTTQSGRGCSRAVRAAAAALVRTGQMPRRVCGAATGCGARPPCSTASRSSPPSWSEPGRPRCTDATKAGRRLRIAAVEALPSQGQDIVPATARHDRPAHRETAISRPREANRRRPRVAELTLPAYD